MMKIDSFGGMNVAEVSDILAKENLLLYLGGEEKEEDVAALSEQHGPRAGALLVAAMLFVGAHGSRMGVYEAAKLWRQAGKLSTKEIASTILDGAYNLESWLSWGGHPFDKNPGWSVALDEMNADEMFSLGNFLIACSIKDDPGGDSTCHMLGIMMAAKTLQEVNEKARKKTHKKSPRKRSVAR